MEVIFLSPPLFDTMKTKLLSASCIVIGVVFVFSGLGKVVNTAAFGNLIVQYGFENLQIFAPAIVIAEIFVGMCLILGIKSKINGIISAGLLITFTLAFTYGHFKNGITDCGCFGTLKISSDNIEITYARNILLLGLSLFVGFYYQPTCEKTSETKKMVLSGVLLPTIFFAGLTYRLPPRTSAEQSHVFLNKNIEETQLYQYVQTVSDSTYLIFFYTYTCPHCWNSIENLKRFKSGGYVDSIVSFALVNDYSEKKSEIKNLFGENFPDFRIFEILNDSILQSFVRVAPTSFYVKNDTIKAVIESTLPHPYIFGLKNR